MGTSFFSLYVTAVSYTHLVSVLQDAEYLLQVQGVFYIFVLANAVTQAGHPQVVPESFSDYIAVDYRS